MIQEIPWGYSREMYAGSLPGGRWADFFGTPVGCKISGHRLEDIVRVRVTVDPVGEYFGWWYSDHLYNTTLAGGISMIFRMKIMVEICFPYGTAIEESIGRGRVVPLRVEQVPSSNSPALP